MDFKDDKLGCPWHDAGDCRGEVSYNRHVNDPRYGKCCEETCPIIYWIEIFKYNKEAYEKI